MKKSTKKSKGKSKGKSNRKSKGKSIDSDLEEDLEQDVVNMIPRENGTDQSSLVILYTPKHKASLITNVAGYGTK